MLGTPSIRRYPSSRKGNNATGADNQQERSSDLSGEILRDHTPDSSLEPIEKIWSDLHGDMQRPTEMIGPPIALSRQQSAVSRNASGWKLNA